MDVWKSRNPESENGTETGTGSWTATLVNVGNTEKSSTVKSFSV